MNEQEKIRMLELFSDKAIFGLDEAEFAELAELEINFPKMQEASAELSYSLEASAAAIPHGKRPQWSRPLGTAPWSLDRRAAWRAVLGRPSRRCARGACRRGQANA